LTEHVQSGSPLNLFGGLLRLMSLTAGWIIVALMIYTVVDVVLRYIFNSPFSGSLEITEFAMSAIVFLGIAYCGWVGGHVSVDVIEKGMTSLPVRTIRAVLLFAGAITLGAMAWLTAHEALGSMQRISNMMRWPHWPFQMIVALGSAMYCIVLLKQVADLLRSPR
jgi:TRAP-type C4-dicarboxylate transport system permease small subunit